MCIRDRNDSADASLFAETNETYEKLAKRFMPGPLTVDVYKRQVKDRETKEPFPDAGKMIYQKAFSKGLAWVPSGHILRLSPPMILDDDAANKGLDIIEEAIAETEKHFGY